jgi:hypothetical protein
LQTSVALLADQIRSMPTAADLSEVIDGLVAAPV